MVFANGPRDGDPPRPQPRRAVRGRRRRAPGLAGTLLSETRDSPLIPLAPAAAVCLLVAAGSLALPAALGYDPYAWLVWGRELAHLDLATTGGPSFKPLPALVTAPFGDLAPTAWALIVRATGLLGIVFAFRVAARLAGPVAGATAALAAALAEGQVRNGLQGYSEPLLIGLALGAVDAHLAGRTRLAFGVGVLGSLVRPELWLLVLLYAFWRWRADAGFRPALAVGVAAVPALWVGFDWWGSGALLHGSDVARSTPPESAALTDRPALTVVRRAAELVAAAVVVAAVAAAVLAVRRRDRVVMALAAAAAGWVLAVAVMAEDGFTGNIRYLAVPAGLLAVLGGVGTGWVVAMAPAERRGAATAAAAALLLAFWFVPAREDWRWLSVAREQHDQLGELRDATDLAGGRGAVLAPGRPAVNPSVATALAWELDVPLARVQATWGSTPRQPRWRPPAVVFRAPPRFAGTPPSLAGASARPLGRAGRWQVSLARGRG